LRDFFSVEKLDLQYIRLKGKNNIEKDRKEDNAQKVQECFSNIQKISKESTIQSDSLSFGETYSLKMRNGAAQLLYGF